MAREPVFKKKRSGKYYYWMAVLNYTVNGESRRKELKNLGRVTPQFTKAKGFMAFKKWLRVEYKKTVSGDITLEEVHQRHLDQLQLDIDTKQLKPRSMKNYETFTEEFISKHGYLPIKELDKSDIQKTLKPLYQRGLANRSIRLRCESISKLLHYAKKEKLLTDIPEIPWPVKEKKKPGEIRFLTPDEIDACFEASNVNQSLYMVMILSTGIRASEAANIRAKDVSIKNARVSIPDNGKKLGGIVKIDTSFLWVWKILKDGKDYEEKISPYIDNDGKGAGRAMKRLAVKAGIPSFTATDLRHTYATLRLSQGINETQVAQELRHSPAILREFYSGQLEKINQKEEDSVKLGKLIKFERNAKMGANRGQKTKLRRVQND